MKAYAKSDIAPSSASATIPEGWASEIISQAVERGIGAHRISASLGAFTDTDKVRAAVIAATSDQAVGIVRELRDDYGIAAAAIFPEQLLRGAYPAALTRAQLVVTTAELEPSVRSTASLLRKSLIVVRVRPDLFSEDWIAFMNGPVYVVVSDPRFRMLLRPLLRPVPGAENVTVLLAGSHDLARVPRDARTYVTESARRMLGRTGLPGRVIRPRRASRSYRPRRASTTFSDTRSRKWAGTAAAGCCPSPSKFIMLSWTDWTSPASWSASSEISPTLR